MITDINNLGSFSSMNAVWAKYPEGGREGDYLTIGGVMYRWNKILIRWDNAEVDNQSRGRDVERFLGDVTIDNDLTVAGTIRAKGIKQPNCGLFATLAALEAKYPYPELGMWATVGNTVPADVYRCDKRGVWAKTGEKGGMDSMDWERIETLESKVNSNASENTTIKGNLTSLQTQLNTLLNGNASEAIESFNEVITFLANVKDTETLTGILTDLRTAIMLEGTNRANDFASFETQYQNDMDVVITRLYSEIASAILNAKDVIHIGVWADKDSDDEFSQMLGASSYNFGYNTKKNELWRKTPDIIQKVTPSADVLYIDVVNCTPYIWKEETMSAIAPKNAPASIFNATTEKPVVGGYYTLCDPVNTEYSAVHVALSEGKIASGLILSFERGAGIWKTYQYVGKTLTETNWLNPENWKDFGSLAAGSETYINIDELCGSPTGGSYTLGSAVDALLAYQERTGVNYAKKGLIISYKTGQNEMESKQFQGELSDFKEVGLWKDFGGSGRVETKDEAEKEGKDALSTGGAYNIIPANLKIDTETEGVVKLSLVNAEGEAVGDEQQFSVGTGGGGSFSGTIVSAAFKKSPMYGNAGGEFKVEASIRSISTNGSEENLNMIEKVELYDRDTNVLLDTYNENKSSSATLQDYDFEFDLSAYMTVAGTKRFKMVFYDDSGNTGSRNINLVAVDVTISSTQTLQYSPSTVLEVNGAAKSISLYKFANNANQITAITEIFLDGTWQKLVEDRIVKDTYSVSEVIDPKNCVGRELTHGVYQLRIHGEDKQSGVVGNYLYTSLFVIGASTTPLVATRWYSSEETSKIKIYESVNIEYAVYDPNTTTALAMVFLGSELVSSHTAYRTDKYMFTRQITTVQQGATFDVKVTSGAGAGPIATFLVEGSVLDAALKEGAIYSFDFSNRSNEDADKSIVSNGYEIKLNGCNYSTTGFMTFNGRRCLRVAENVTGEMTHQPFGNTSLEQNGMGLQFCFASKNLPDDDAILMSCSDSNNGAGFYVTGKVIGIYCGNQKEERFYEQNKETTVAVVVEPAQEGLGVNWTPSKGTPTTYYFIRLYINGEEVAVINYTAGNNSLFQRKNISFNGEVGELYMFYIVAWDDYFQFDQAFQNYLTKLVDTSAMISEYEFEDVMEAQEITEYGKTSSKLRPKAVELYNRGMAYFVECPYNRSDIEDLDDTTSTDDSIFVTLYYYNPQRPWQNFVAYDVLRKNQGTTSALRPVKNPRYYLAAKKGSSYDSTAKTGGTWIVLLNPDESTEAGRTAIALAKCNKMQLYDDSIPVDTITVKLDYSDSSNANDCGVCDQMNATYRALGGDYLTPAQRAYDGTWEGTYADADDKDAYGKPKTKTVKLTGLKLNHSTANHPAAMFRSKDPLGTNPYFHAKGNWKEDKKEQVALGFKDVPGYNKGCLNYGDFIEFYGLQDETLAETKTRFLQTEGLNTKKPYILTEYCGSSYEVMRYKEGAWAEQNGSMKQVDGRWVITGDVMNPVDGFELLSYEGMCWFRGVGSVEDMMRPTKTFSKWVKSLNDKGKISITTAPAWTEYFECLLDDDDLAIAYAEGRKVPYNLFTWLMFCNSCDPKEDEHDESVLQAALKRWHDEVYKHASPHSIMSYDVFTDYDAAVDQRAKNMQPMWFLEDGAWVENGVYHNSVTIGCNALRMYLNKIYDCDTCNSKDNDGGQTVDAETDPNRIKDASYDNPYKGWNSILFRNIFLQQDVLTSEGDTIGLTLQNVAAAMRSCQTTVDGITLKPFSPEGAEHFFVGRMKKWQKKVSSYDGERKYIQFTEPNGTAVANELYFYALQGLGLTALPAFIERRWRYRDGFFGVGSFTENPLAGRVYAPAGARIRITAAKSGYFGIGHEQPGNIDERIYLEAGQSYEFTKLPQSEGASFYIYQPDRISKIDLSEITLGQSFATALGSMTLVEEMRLGSASYVAGSLGGMALMTTLNLGELAYLKTLHIENMGLTRVTADKCSRLANFHAYGSKLEQLDLADGARIELLELPSTYNTLSLRYLPLLKKENIHIESVGNIATLIVESCDKIDAWSMLMQFAEAWRGTTQERVVRITPVSVVGDGAELDTLAALNLAGLNARLIRQEKPAIVGTYRMENYADDDKIKEWQDVFGEDLKVRNALYSKYTIHDMEAQPYNITNEDNKTGYRYNGSTYNYVPSGYIKSIRKYTVPVIGIPNNDGSKMELKLLKKSDNTKLHTGESYNRTSEDADGYDIFVRFPHFWYKGINDYKQQEKHILLSYGTEEPTPTWTKKESKKLSELVYRNGYAILVGTVALGDELRTDCMYNIASCAVYRADVEGMKQVRYYGMNSVNYGDVFVDADNKVIKTVKLSISGTTDSPLDYNSNCYLFESVPEGAKWFYFTCETSVDQNNEVLTVDSSDIEAIEPGWVEHHADLVGLYGMVFDLWNRARSLTGKATVTGTGTQVTSGDWRYDAEGNPVAHVQASTNRTYQDMLNLCRARGKGYHSISYEQSKILAILSLCWCGHRDEQALYGNGTQSKYTSGQSNTYGMDSRNAGGGVNKIWNVEGAVSCNWEIMDFIGVNIDTFKGWKAMGRSQSGPVDGKAHIYDPHTDTERIMPYQTTSQRCIARIVLGRYCDYFAASVNAYSSKFINCYCAGTYYQAQAGRCVGRGFYNAYAVGGLVYASANNASSYSYSDGGARLAFSGEITNNEEIDNLIEQDPVEYGVQ